MSTALATRPKAPKVTGTVLAALLAQRGGFVVQDCTPAGAGVVYALETLTGAQLDDPDVLVLLDYAEAAERIHRDGGTAAAARSLTAVYANAAARGLL